MHGLCISGYDSQFDQSFVSTIPSADPCCYCPLLHDLTRHILPLDAPEDAPDQEESFFDFIFCFCLSRFASALAAFSAAIASSFARSRSSATLSR